MFFPLCCILTCAAASELNSTTSLQHQRRTQQMLQHLPPAPVTPFRGGLAARSRNNNDNKDSSSHTKNDHVNSNNGDGSVEASSSDYNNNNNNRHQSSSSLRRTHNNNIRSFSSSWTPEDFPDPWINPLQCGGAATASQLKLNQQLHPNNHTNINPKQSTQMKRPLFCDPDQVLDKPTLRTVMMKLREFSQEFASKNFVEGGDFGLWEVDDFNEEQEEEQQQSDDIDGLDSSEDLHDDENDGLDSSEDVPSDENEGRPDQSTHNLRRRRLQQHHASNQGNNPITNKHSMRHLSSSSNNNNKGLSDTDTVEVAIALVQKINLPAILRADSYFFYSDQDDMVNDAAQYFARYVHDTWNRRVMQEQTNDSSVTTNIVLIFISVHDRICYISSGTRIATILPWWRLEHVVQDMKPLLRKGHTGDALEVAIDDMTSLLRAGSPTVKDRMDDFFERFGVVLAFAFFTFLFATYGEFQDRRKRVVLAERRSRMTVVEKEKARSMQREFQTKACPICLETFGGSSSNNESGKDDITVDADASTLTKKERARKKEQKQKMKRVDSHGIPLKGNDERPIKFLRCGHIFDESCWKMWVDSGHGNSMMCPVCRQDIGRGKRRNRQQDAGDTATSANNDGNHSGQQQSLFLRIMEHAHAATAPATLLRPINNLHTTNYGSTNYGSTLWSSTRPDYEEGLNDSSATSFYSTENTPLI